MNEPFFPIDKETKEKNTLIEAVKFGFGFYIGFTLARTMKRLFVAVHK